MEKVITYNLTNTIDKHISYLAGVGYNLSFELLYYMRLQKLGVRIMDSMISVARKAYSADETSYVFGEIHKEVEYRFKNLSLERYHIKQLDFIKGFIYNERYRETKISLMQPQPRLSTYRDVEFQNKLLSLEDNIKSGIYGTEHMRVIPAQRNTFGQKEILPKLKEDGGFNMFEQPDFVENPLPDINKPYKDLFTYIHTDEGIFHAEIVMGSRFEKGIYNNTEDIFLKFDTNGIDIDEQISAAVGVAKVYITDDADNLGKHTVGLDQREDYLILGTESPKIDFYEGELVGGDDQVIEILEDGNFVVQEKKGIFSNKTLHASNPDKTLFGTRTIFADQPIKGAFGYTQDFATTYDIGLLFDDGVNWFGQRDIGIDVDKHNRGAFKHSMELGGVDDFCFLSTDDIKLNTDYTDTIISKRAIGMQSSDDVLTAQKDSKPLYELYASDFLLSKKPSAAAGLSSITATKGSKGVESNKSLFGEAFATSMVINEDMFLRRNNSYGVQYNKIIAATKGSTGILNNRDTMAYKVCKHPIRNDSNLFGSKEMYGITTDGGVQATRYNIRDIEFNKYELNISKYFINASINDTFLGFNKKAFDTDIDGSFYAIDKNRKATSTENSDVLIDKYYQPVFEQNDIYNVTKRYRPTMTNDVFFGIDKLYKPTDINNPLTNISKAPYRTSIRSFAKWIVIPMRPIGYIDTDELVTKEAYDTDISSTEVNYVKQYRDTYTNESICVDASPYDTKIDSQVFMKRPNRYDSTIETNGFVGDEKTAQIDEHKSLHRERTFGLDIDVQVGATSSKPIVVDDPNNFAYTDKTDYTLIKDDRVDELELPPTDFNYSKFARKLFVDGSIDARYIKKIDEETGNPIVSLPVENPVRYFADLAVHYMDLNVGMLTYIIEKVYNIWQNNIFVYSAMSSDGALNDMLRKLKQNLFIQYPSEKDQEHLHRAIRLFRWYCEMSILNNSDYMLKLSYKDLEVDYANRDLSSILKIGAVDNFAIDSSYVLSQVDNTRMSSINLSFTRNHKTRLKFDLAVTDGTCTVTVNKVSTTYIDEFVNIDIVINEGDTEIEIVFNPANPNAYVGIMKFAIVQYDIKSYEVEYIGRIGEFNPTANHLVTMLSVCGDSIEDMQKTLAHNAPTVAALDKLREYFDLHHQDKLKGKRLIIKH